MVARLARCDAYSGYVNSGDAEAKAIVANNRRFQSRFSCYYGGLPKASQLIFLTPITEK